jgi:hypothetical protein
MASAQEQGDRQSKLDAWLNSPELEELRKSFAAFQKREQAEDQAWWDSLDYEQRAQAFRQVCKLMYKAEIVDRGTYRWAVYDIFGLEYGDGLDHYMTLHNLIGKGLDTEQNYETLRDDGEECGDNIAS